MPDRQTDGTDWVEDVIAVLQDTSDFLALYSDTIDDTGGTPAADLKDRIDDLLR